ncbi:MAG: T9SS type A sorting domain-containing protein [Bacteroidetes bacterium]|nr:T9SS type A sorting domain-containing protein [Bacteroidota bacterium]MCW5931876.1 T9SS type A sorting domain-containing protein [Bacteroidota bacterium]
MKIIKYKIVRHFLCLTILLLSKDCLPQGYNSTWLLGYQAKNRMTFTDSSYLITPELRKIPFEDTQGNISDENGNILMSSNGIFIANATGDTMQQGGGLNPNSYTDDWIQWGLPLLYANLFLPMPDDTNKYILFHLTGNYNSPSLIMPTEIYYSIADMSYNGGLGKVISKNNIALTGIFGGSLAACKHGNGRDWWVIALSDSANYIYKFLITPDTIQYVGSQFLNVQGYPGWMGQPTFSPDGIKFAYSHYDISMGYYWQDIRLFDFDRCDGDFTFNSIAYLPDSVGGFGVAFSPNSQYLYASSWKRIYQLDTYSANIPASMQLVATNDSFASPSPPFYTDFWEMYLAANGKIYLTSGSGVVHLHEMDYPDSVGMACNVNLHNVFINNFNFRTVPNHPNYYLGRKIGSPCDTIPTGFEEKEHDFKFKIFPNPNNGNFKIMYLLPQNKAGKLEIFDINGRAVYSQNLPQWSTLQFISLPKLSNGIYAIKINSNNFSITKKLIIHHE